MEFKAIEALEATPPAAPGWVKPVSLFVADILAAVIAFCLALAFVVMIRDILGIPPLEFREARFDFHTVLVASLTAAVLLWFRSRGHYKQRQALADQIGAVLAAAVIGMLTSAAIQFATLEVGSRLLTGLYWVVLVPAILLGRLFVRRLLRATGAWAKPAVVFTSQNRVSDLATFIGRRDEVGVHITQAVCIQNSAAEVVADAIAEAHNKGLSALYAPAPGDNVQSEVIERLVVRGVPFILSPDIGPIPHRSSVMEFPPEDIALIEIFNPLDRELAMRAKRVIDIIGAVAGLIALSPFLIPIVVAVKADGGPAVFRQKRVGKGGRTFECMKFRSMAVDAEARLQAMIASDPAVRAEWEANYKLRKDPRVTAIGRVLRKTNIDELPQLINILRGDMSIVGPRPVSEPETRKYGDAFHAYKRVRPGLTGLWQTNGRNNTTFEQRVRLDAWYVRNWSLWRDLIIIVRTVREVLFARGV